MNNDLRIKIAEMIENAGEGHIPSSYSILDIIEVLYRKFINIEKIKEESLNRDYFFLSKGHGCAALYTVLNKHGIINDEEIERYSTSTGILGGHPDVTSVPGIEASTGSLGHGLPIAVGTALGCKLKGLDNKIYVLMGDGECHEGSVWEAANVAANRQLNNITAIIDLNGSAKQLMPIDEMQSKWEAFGWVTIQIDGHSEKQIEWALKTYNSISTTKPSVIIANTVKGKGVSFLEGHGNWHHKIPNKDELRKIIGELKK